MRETRFIRWMKRVVEEESEKMHFIGRMKRVVEEESERNAFHKVDETHCGR